VGFAFAGATHGLTKNPSFAENWAMMKRCGLPRAAYHFLTDKSEGALQARAFAEQIEKDPGELPPALDVEKPSDCRGDCCQLSCTQWNVITRAFVDELKRRTSREPMIYTVEPFWNQCLCGTTNYKNRPLWLAGWPRFDFPERLRFGGWTAWTFYQYAGNVRVAGGVIDLNLFRGTAEDLDRWIRTGKPPEGE
jgi:lysozyme